MPSAFAKKQLEKYGWQAGEGLGKDKEGRADYVKVSKRKTEGVGIGHEAAKGGTTNDDMGLNSVLQGMGKNAKRDSSVILTGGSSSSDDSSDDEKKTTGRKQKKVLAERQKRTRDVSSSSSDSSDSSDDEGGVSSDITKWDDKKLFAKCNGVRLGRAGRHRMFDGKLKRIQDLEKTKSSKGEE